MIMETRTLKLSPVLFDEEKHTYELYGQHIQGVTPIVAWLFPETYKGIPESVLNNAAAYGSMIHKKVELCDSLGIVDHDSIRAYQEIKEQHGTKTLYNEYLVSDEHRIASSIDLVMEGFDLWDIKTTSKVHIPNVTIQLSIYAWLFEQQNDGVKAGELYCLWLPKPQYGQADLIHLERVPSSIIEEIVNIWWEDTHREDMTEEWHHNNLMNARSLLAQTGFQFEKVRAESDIPDAMQHLMDELIMVSENIKQLQEREAEIKSIVFRQMVQDGIDKYGNDLIQFSRKAAYERESIDTKELKAKMPEVYESFKKVTKVKESLTYKVL